MLYTASTTMVFDCSVVALMLRRFQSFFEETQAASLYHLAANAGPKGMLEVLPQLMQ